MNSLLKIAVLTLFLGLSYAAEEDVMVLTESNFDQFIQENKFVLVEFYAPWCGHCKALAPEYASAAGTLKEEEVEARLAKVDATVESALGTKFEVKGYPTLKFFKNGTPLDYQGGRQAADIVNWLKKKTGPPLTLLTSEEEVTKFKENNEVVVIAHFADAESDNAQTYTKVADSIDDVPFGLVTDADVAKFADVAADQVVVFKQFDEGRADFDGEVSDEEALSAFVKGNQLRLVTEFTPETAPKIFGGEVEVHNLLFIAKSSPQFEELLAAFTESAKVFKGKVLFIFIDSDEEDNKRVMEFFGLTEEDVPDYRIIKMADNMAKFKPDTKELTTEAITEFTNSVVEGKTKRHLMSAALPEDWNSKPVHTLVGSNFKEVAYNKDKKVFVEFYAPWCGHCKSLKPIWDSLGEAYKDDDDVVISVMDSTANEVAEFEISGFPTIKYFPSGSDEVVDYDGDRTLEAMKVFVDSNGEKVSGGDGEEEVDEDDIGEEMDDELPEEEEQDEGHTEL